MAIWQLFKLNFQLEWRERQSYFAILVYVLSTAYLAYLTLSENLEPETWNAFFWVIFIFAAVQAAYRSFSYEAERRFLFYFSWVRPQSLILGKILYNFLYLLAVGLLTGAVLFLLMGPRLASPGAALFILVLAALGFSAILTFTAGIAAKAGGNPALPAILSIPLLYPQIIALSRVSLRALTGFSWEINLPFLIVLALLALVSILLSYLLFPYLWRD